MNSIYKMKSLERLEIAKWQMKTENTLTLGSTLYFALFNFMQSVLDEPYENKWKHIGINKHFSKYCKKHNLIDSSVLKNIYRTYEKLYVYRVKSDYRNDTYTEEEIKELEIIFDFLYEVIKKWQS